MADNKDEQKENIENDKKEKKDDVEKKENIKNDFIKHRQMSLFNHLHFSHSKTYRKHYKHRQYRIQSHKKIRHSTISSKKA